MSFEIFEVTDTKNPPPGTGVGVSLICGRGRNAGKGSLAKLNITVSGAVGDSLGWKAQGQHVRVLLGGGDQHGIIRLIEIDRPVVGSVEIVERAPMKSMRYFRIKLGHVASFVSRVEKKQQAQWEKLENEPGIEIILPAWAEETAPNKKPMAGVGVGGVQRTIPRAAKIRAEMDAADDRVVEKLDQNRYRESARTGRLQAAYDLEPRQAQILEILADRYPSIKRQQLYELIYSGMANGGPDPKIIDVYLSKMRVKLARFDVIIENLHGAGVGLTKKSRAIVLTVLEASK